MAQMQFDTACDDCTSLLQNAATILSESASVSESSSRQTEGTPYDKQYQARLLAKVASSECYMCALFQRHIPRLSESLELGEELQIIVQRALFDPLAANIRLVELSGKDERRIIGHYPGVLRVQEGKMRRIPV